MATKSIGTLRAQLVLDTDQWLGGFAKAGKGASTFASLFGGIGGKLAATVAGVASVGTVMHSLATGMEQVDRQAKLADRLGITVGEVQKLGFAADLAGTDLDTLSHFMLKMAQNIGTGGKSLDRRLLDVADSLAAIKDVGEQQKRIAQIFGRGSEEIINTLIQGSRNIRDSAAAIDRFGLELSRLDAAKIEAANDAWTEMTTILGGLRNKLLVEVSPAMAGFLDVTIRGLEVIKIGLDDVATKLGKIGVTLRGAGESFLSSVLGGLGVPGAGLLAGKAFKGLAGLEAAGNARVAAPGGPLGRSVLGGATGGGPLNNAAERGSAEAARIIQGAKSYDKEQLDALLTIAKNTAPSLRGGGPVIRRAG